MYENNYFLYQSLLFTYTYFTVWQLKLDHLEESLPIRKLLEKKG